MLLETEFEEDNNDHDEDSDSEGMKQKDWDIISNLPGNNNCIDCNAKYPEWASINFGILFCTRCCSGHRSLGSHISRVKSIRLDHWTEKQIHRMIISGGNKKFQEWFLLKNNNNNNNGILLLNSPSFITTTIIKSHKIKYDNPIAKLYTEILDEKQQEARIIMPIMQIHDHDDDNDDGRRKKEKEATTTKSWKEAKQQQQQLLRGEQQQQKQQRNISNLIPRIIKMTSSSDFWLYLYAALMILSFVLWIGWNLREVYRNYIVVVVDYY